MAAEVSIVARDSDGIPWVPTPLAAESLSIRARGVERARLAVQDADLSQKHKRDLREVPTYDKFYFAIVCALQLEYNAVISSVDYQWPTTPFDPDDPNVYTLAKMGGHNVVIVRPLDVGPGQVQSITEALRRKFTKVALFLVVGICGAVPFFPVQPDPEQAVRRIIFGDVIISSSIAQYLYRGQARPDGFQMRNILNGSGWSMQPSPRARALAQALEGPNWLEIAKENMLGNLVQLQGNQHGVYMYPGAERDKLYEASYVHKHHKAHGCACAKDEYETCEDAMRTACQDICDEDFLIIDGESQQRGGSPNIYLGSMASGDIIMRSGELRDKISREQEVMAFEMEGAGVQIGSSSCLVIKAASDYADSHKKKDFQHYAAGVAASAAKAVLQWYSPEPEDGEFFLALFKGLPYSSLRFSLLSNKWPLNILLMLFLIFR